MNKSQLEKLILEKEHQIAKLKDNVDLSPVCADLYNKAILEKAILRQQLKEITTPITEKITDKVRKYMPFSERRICDFFKS